MRVNVKEFLSQAGVTEAFYPGKRMVHMCRQPGEFKSHCMVLDWRDPARIRIELKAGLTGRPLDPKDLKFYPLTLQSPTYVDIEVINDNGKGESEESSSGSSSSSGGGGKQPAKKPLSLMSKAFETVTEGQIPSLGKIVDMMVMGVKVAAEKYGNVMGVLAKQMSHAKIAVTDLLAQTGDFITKYTPPSFMLPTGTEDKVYRYDREKNADIGFRPGLG